MFLAEYCKCRLDPDTEGYDANKFDEPKNIYKSCFDQIIDVEEFNVRFGNKSDFQYNCAHGHLKHACSLVKNRFTHANGYWRYFPNSAIAGYIFGFFSVISWVGMGYFANALRSATTEDKSKFNVFINSLAGIFDTVACGFILYSLIVGAPMFSIPMIIAAAVSVLLRVIFTVFIFKNINENKKLITEYVNMDQILGDIEKHLEQHQPKEVQEQDKEVKEFQGKPKESEKDSDGNKDGIGKGN